MATVAAGYARHHHPERALAPPVSLPFLFTAWQAGIRDYPVLPIPFGFCGTINDDFFGKFSPNCFRISSLALPCCLC
jgi:hypothetical protein